MDEFALIAEYLAPLAAPRPGALGLADDAALVDTPPGRVLVASADALVAGVHFREREQPDTVAARALRSSLSDLAAMGAEPHGYLLTLALPHSADAGWMRAFASQLARDQEAFSVALLGGDTVATPGPLTVSLTVLGFAEPGRLLRRSGARPGDAVCVSGVIGDAALALALPDAPEALWRRFRLPEPRIALGRALAGVATAAIDVSDGLVADLDRLCAASGVGARVDAASAPLSPAARDCVRRSPELIETVLCGGDDYELLFALPPARLDLLGALPAPACRIGVFTEGGGVTVRGADGAPLVFAAAGWRHFRSAPRSPAPASG